MQNCTVDKGKTITLCLKLSFMKRLDRIKECYIGYLPVCEWKHLTDFYTVGKESGYLSIYFNYKTSKCFC